MGKLKSKWNMLLNRLLNSLSRVNFRILIFFQFLVCFGKTFLGPTSLITMELSSWHIYFKTSLINSWSYQYLFSVNMISTMLVWRYIQSPIVAVLFFFLFFSFLVKGHQSAYIPLNSLASNVQWKYSYH